MADAKLTFRPESEDCLFSLPYQDAAVLKSCLAVRHTVKVCHFHSTKPKLITVFT